MSLYETMQSELLSAMKAGETEKRDALRYVGSALKNEAIEKRKPVTDLSDEETVAVIRRLAKQRADSIESYRAGGREDLVAKEETELRILESYLPAAMPESELRRLLDEAKAETGAATRADFGKLMGAMMGKVAGRADGAAVKKLVDESLA